MGNEQASTLERLAIIETKMDEIKEGQARLFALLEKRDTSCRSCREDLIGRINSAREECPARNNKSNLDKKMVIIGIIVLILSGSSASMIADFLSKFL